LGSNDLRTPDADARSRTGSRYQLDIDITTPASTSHNETSNPIANAGLEVQHAVQGLDSWGHVKPRWQMRDVDDVLD
jgi:hypothetical protein